DLEEFPIKNVPSVSRRDSCFVRIYFDFLNFILLLCFRQFRTLLLFSSGAIVAQAIVADVAAKLKYKKGAFLQMHLL
ncbi:MAG: hypothetical protein ACI4QE_02295, partial [Acutalibacteraceae bacterium]